MLFETDFMAPVDKFQSFSNRKVGIICPTHGEISMERNHWDWKSEVNILLDQHRYHMQITIVELP